MDTQLIILIDSPLLKDATQILDQIGLDMQSVIKIFLKRLVREQNISFLLSNSLQPQTNELLHEIRLDNNNAAYDKTSTRSEKSDMTKSKAIAVFRNKGETFNGNITFASKNRAAYNYWANPEFSVLHDNWYIILNDWKNRELYLFHIPANLINSSELTPRNDKSYLIDLQIMYNDNSFRDNRSGYCFAKYLIDQAKY